MFQKMKFYKLNGSGPNGGTDLAEWANRGLAEDVRDGFRCNYYDERAKITAAEILAGY